MKKVILMFLVISVACNLSAQKRDNIADLNPYQLKIYKEKAVEMRKNGIGLTIYGASFIAAGGIISACWLGALSDNEENLGIPIIPFVIGLAIGTPLLIVGIPLWAIGGYRKSNAEIAIKNLLNAPEKSPLMGLSLTIRF